MAVSLNERTRRLLAGQLRLAEKTARETESYNPELAETITNLARAVATFGDAERKREAWEHRRDKDASPEERAKAVRVYLGSLAREDRAEFRKYLDELDEQEIRL